MSLSALVYNKGCEFWRDIKKIASFVFLLFISPRQTDPDLKRKELVLNSILGLIISLLIVDTSLVVFSLFNRPHYHGVSISILLSIDVFFSCLFLLSRKGHLRTSSYSLIFGYFLLATYGSYLWGVDLPSSLLSYALLVVISSILVSTRFGFVMSIIIAASISGLIVLEESGLYSPLRTWQFAPLLLDDGVEYGFIIFIIAGISWLSNRETESSLNRARRSEKELREERDSLEETVTARTKELKQIQLEKVSELYRFVEFGKLAGGLFHDLMSPLTSLSLSIEGLQKQGIISDPGILKNIDSAIKSSDRMANFIKGIKKRIQRSEMESVFFVKEEIDQVIDFLSSKWKLAGVVIDDSECGNIPMLGNPTMFHHILTNLISNSIDAYEGISGSEKVITIKAIDNTDFINISVIDRGKGIPFEIISSIFEPFFTTKAHTGGSGIGLSATKHAIAKYFKGSISATSTTTEGTIFNTTFLKRRYEPTRPIDKDTAKEGI